MAPAGTRLQSFTLNNRTIFRRDGRLTLDDDTLAGADLDLTSAIRFMHQTVGIDLESALRSATTVPRSLLSPVTGSGRGLTGTRMEDMIRIGADLLSVAPLEFAVR